MKMALRYHAPCQAIFVSNSHRARGSSFGECLLYEKRLFQAVGACVHTFAMHQAMPALCGVSIDM